MPAAFPPDQVCDRQLSHELRTPLSVINGYVELLLDGGSELLSARGASWLEALARNSARLVTVVQNLVLLAERDSKRLTYSCAELALGALAAERLDAGRILAGERELTVAVGSSVTPPVHGDRCRLATALDNLIINAIRFTERDGRIELKVGRVSDGVLVEVIDDGCGMAAAECEAAFEPFYRGRKAIADEVPGLGIGLTVARGMAEDHGGRVSLASEEGAGTAARLWLPFRADRERLA